MTASASGASAEPDRWLVVEVPTTADRDVTDRLIEVLADHSDRGVEELDGCLVAYFRITPEELPATLSRLQGDFSQSALSAHGGVLPLQHRWQADRDWVDLWRKGVRPRRVSSRLVVCPTWEKFEANDRDIVIHLDPGMAFGTAEHPTTRGCLRLLEHVVAPGDRIADVGCGSGILSVAAAALGAAEVLAIDLDPLACQATTENAELNGVADRIRVLRASFGADDVVDEPLATRSFDGIVSNIQADVLLFLLSALRDGLRPNGWLVLSGIQVHESDDVIDACESLGFSQRSFDREPDSEWWSGAFGR